MALPNLDLPRTQRAIVFPARGEAEVREVEVPDGNIRTPAVFNQKGSSMVDTLIKASVVLLFAVSVASNPSLTTA